MDADPMGPDLVGPDLVGPDLECSCPEDDALLAGLAAGDRFATTTFGRDLCAGSLPAGGAPPAPPGGTPPGSGPPMP